MRVGVGGWGGALGGRQAHTFGRPPRAPPPRTHTPLHRVTSTPLHRDSHTPLCAGHRRTPLYTDTPPVTQTLTHPFTQSHTLREAPLYTGHRGHRLSHTPVCVSVCVCVCVCQGIAAIVGTRGNPYCHVIHRGGRCAIASARAAPALVAPARPCEGDGQCARPCEGEGQCACPLVRAGWGGGSAPRIGR
jgi:hypothetical protein